MLKKMMENAPSAKSSAILVELESGSRIFEFNADMQMASASTIKVLIMAEVMRRAEAGIADLHATVVIPRKDKLEDSIIGILEAESFSLLDLVTLMIVVSDNTATNVIIDLVGMESVNSLASILGLKQTSLQRKMLDWQALAAGKQNYTSGNDLIELFSLIGNRKLPGSNKMLKILLNQKQGAFRRDLPESVAIAHKPGGLENLSHDVGIFYLPGGNYIWSVMAEGAPNLTASEFIGKITKNMYDMLTK